MEGNRIVLNDSQTSPPFAQVVKEDPSGEPAIFGGIVDYKDQVRSVSLSERRMRTPSASRPAVPVNDVMEGNGVVASPVNEEGTSFFIEC